VKHLQYYAVGFSKSRSKKRLGSSPWIHELTNRVAVLSSQKREGLKMKRWERLGFQRTFHVSIEMLRVAGRDFHRIFYILVAVLHSTGYSSIEFGNPTSWLDWRKECRQSHQRNETIHSFFSSLKFHFFTAAWRAHQGVNPLETSNQWPFT
jgi:hypothetical protein